MNAVVLVIGGYQIGGLNIVRVRVFTSSGTTGGGGRGDAKTIILLNTSFGDIITIILSLST